METVSHALPAMTNASCSNDLAGDRSSADLHTAAVALADGDLQGLDTIWRLCADELYGLALWRTGRPDDAEDVVQEVFVRLARMPERLVKARKPRSYLLRMAHNSAIDLIKKRRPGEQLAEDAPYLVDEPDADGKLAAEQVCRLLTRLPRQQREAIYLRHFAELSFREIGAVCGVPTFTAASRYRLAMRRLRILLAGEVER
jgi:RNA polymerase sigma-70 factor (ECF subfamily)